MFGFESIRPSPSFLPRRSTPSARLPSRPAPLPLHFGAFSFPPRRGGVETILTARAGRGVGGTRCVMQISQLLIGWRRASGGGAGARGSRPVPPLPHPLSSLRWPRSRAPRLGLPERPRPIPTRPRAPPSARSAPLLLAAGRARRLLQRPRWRRRPERTWRQRRRWRDRQQQQQQQLRAPCVAALPHEP